MGLLVVEFVLRCFFKLREAVVMKKIIFSLFVSFCSLSFAGPFGMEFGMKPEDFKKLGIHLDKGHSEWNFDFTDSPPEKNPHFFAFSVDFSEKYGLCRIQALSHTIKTDGYGKEIQSAFVFFEKILDEKYKGEKMRRDEFNPQTQWSSPKHWLKSLKEKDRVLSALWIPRKGEKFVDNIESIVLESKTFNGESSGNIEISYESSNIGKCLAEWSEKKKQMSKKGL